MAYVVFLGPNDIVIPWYLKEIANSVFHFMISAVYVTMLSMTYHYIIGAPDSGDGGKCRRRRNNRALTTWRHRKKCHDR